MFKFVLIWYVILINSFSIAININGETPIHHQSSSCAGKNCQEIIKKLSLTYYKSVYCMGDLVKGFCTPVCQESCISNQIVKDVNCVATSCRVGCACPKNRPLRKGLKCIKRSECGNKVVNKNDIKPTSTYTTTMVSYINNANIETTRTSKTVKLVSKGICAQGFKYIACLPYCQLYCDTKSSRVFPLCSESAKIGCKPGCVCDISARFKTQRGNCVPSCNFKTVSKNIKTTTVSTTSTVYSNTGSCGKGMKYVHCLPYCQLYCDTTSGKVQTKCLKPSTVGCKPGCICDGNARYKVENGSCVSTCNIIKSPVKNNELSRKPGSNLKTSCGVQYYKPNIRIVGGETSIKGSWPWTVQIHGRVGNIYKLKCSGTVVCDRWIVSAAHCFESKSRFHMNTNVANYQVWIGKYMKSMSTNEYYSKKLTIKQIILHPDFDMKTKLHDIALIETYDIIKMTDYVRPACLPPHYVTIDSYTPWGPQLGTSCYVVGWGETMRLGPRNDKLKQAKLSVRPADECNRLFLYYKKETMLCAGGTRRDDACAGDSGGGLFCQHNDGKWYMDGIVSYGVKCGVIGQPAVYTRTTHYKNWISNHIGTQCGTNRQWTLYKNP